MPSSVRPSTASSSPEYERGQTSGQLYGPKIFEIANDLSKMQVECDVDEPRGQSQGRPNVRFTVDAFPETNFNGTVKQVRFSPTVTQNVVTYTIVDADNRSSS